MSTALNRVDFLRAGGALLIGFCAAGTIADAQTSAPINANPTGGPAPEQIDSWLAVHADGGVTAYIGKVELGTGIETAFSQLVAEELDVPVARIAIVQGVTGLTPDQGVTSGSQSLQSGSVPLRKAAAEARAALIELGAARLQLPVAEVTCGGGYVYPRAADRSRGVAYGALVGAQKFKRAVGPQTALKKDGFSVIGSSVPRVDIPAKVFGTFRYMQNVRVPGMWHARMVRPPRAGATLIALDRSGLRDLPAVRVVQKGNVIAVAAAAEWDAIAGARALKATWSGSGLPAQRTLYDDIRTTPGTGKAAALRGDVDGALNAAAKKLSASYTWPFQLHGSIGPSCAVADVRPGGAIIWSGTQGVYPLRAALAEFLALPEPAITINYVEAAGCYGHNGADDAAADAALVSQALGKPVRVQWSRADEHGWEPTGPAMVMDLQAGLTPEGTITAWRNDVFTPTHSTRPNNDMGNLLTAQLNGAAAKDTRFNGGDRNAPISYTVLNQRITVHWQSAAVLRVSALRGLGGTQNSFANESFIDELAHAAGADPVAFRLAHLADPRARDVVTAVAKLAGWDAARTRGRGSDGVLHGRGFAFVQYEVKNAYVATVVDLDVVPGNGAVHLRKVYVAHDCGLIVNPDGLRNQIEGNVIQAASRTLKEQVTFDRNGVTSLDWARYPILRFPEIPDVAITLIDRPAEPALGAGEATTCTLAPAIANAVFAASGARIRDIPLHPARIKAALHTA